jgi:hypothetical protein
MPTRPSGLTLMERYYAINQALNSYLISKEIFCPVIKYGIDPATFKPTWKNQQYDRFPYLQTYISNVDSLPWTSYYVGTLTTFDFQISFFTSPKTEFENDAVFFKPFEAVKNGLANINLNLLQTTAEDGKVTTLADILSMKHHYEFEMKSGSPVPSAFLICKMRAVCGYGDDLSEPFPTLATDLDDAIVITNEV